MAGIIEPSNENTPTSDPGETELAIPRSLMEQALSRRTRWVLIGATIAVALVMGALVYGLMRKYALLQAETRVRDVMLECGAFHQYVQETMHPAVRELKRQGRLPADFYAPELLSSSFIVRSIHEQFSKDRKAAGLPDVRYKLAAIDPRNPVNKADAFEAELIARFNKDRSLTEFREILTEDGQANLFYARPFLEVTENCLACHGKPEEAPQELRATYNWTGGYNLKVGDIIAVESIRSPVGGDLKAANWALAAFLAVSAIVLVLLLANVRLHSLVDDHLQALRESEMRFRTLYDSAIDGFLLIDAETRALSMPNRKIMQMLGYSGRELENLRMPDLHCSGNMLPLEEVFRKQMEGEVSIVHDIPVKRKDGSMLHADISSRPVELDGKPHLLAGYRDVSERKEQQAQQQRLATAAEQAAEAIVIADPDGVIEYVNPAFEKVAGYTRSEVVGQRPSVLKSGQQDAAFYRHLWETISAGDVWRGHFINRRKDGSIYEEDAVISPVVDPAGNIINYVGVKRDVTQEVQMQAQLLQARKMQAVGQLAGGVAHDFNNMLGGILGYADMLVAKLGDRPKLRRFAQRIADAAGQAGDLTGKLLAFSRVGPRLTEPVDTHAAVDDALALLEHSIDPKIQIIRELRAEKTVVLGDATQLQNAILNLGVNARDAMPDGGVLTVCSDNVELDEDYCVTSSFDLKPGAYVHISVGDTGEGMDPETKERAFEPFFTTKRTGKGTGLGLAAVYGTVKSHGGEVRVESEPQSGTVLHMYLPSVEQQAPPRETPSVPATPGQGCLLLVDDEQIIREMGRDVLEDLGYQVVLASDGEEALQVYREKGDRIDAVVLDMVMPKVNGQECFREIRKLDPTAKVILSSGYAQEADISELLHEGLLGFVKKPYRRAELGQALATAFADAGTSVDQAADTVV